MPDLTPIDFILAAALLIACVTDLRSHRIPNELTFPLWLLGILWWMDSSQWWFGIMGFAIAFPLHITLWILGVDRGGDAKLMIGVGAMLGWAEMLEATLWSALLIAPVAAVQLTLQRKWGNFIATGRYLLDKASGKAVGDPPAQTYIPKAPVIAVAVVVARFTTLIASTTPGP